MALAVFSLALAVVGPRWADDAKRDREQELIRIGSIYAKAIADYYVSAPGSLRQYPPELSSLLEDHRRVGTLRHLRRLYADPMTLRPWAVMRGADGGVMGVYSSSDAVPMHSSPLDVGGTVLPPAERYSDWKFISKVPAS